MAEVPTPDTNLYQGEATPAIQLAKIRGSQLAVLYDWLLPFLIGRPLPSHGASDREHGADLSDDSSPEISPSLAPPSSPLGKSIDDMFSRAAVARTATDGTAAAKKKLSKDGGGGGGALAGPGEKSASDGTDAADNHPDDDGWRDDWRSTQRSATGDYRATLHACSHVLRRRGLARGAAKQVCRRLYTRDL